MTIKIRFHGDKAIIRWKNPMEKQFLQQQLVMFRDAMQKTAKISVKDDKGDEMPRVIPIKPPQQILVSGGMVASGEVRQVTNGQMLPAIVNSGEVVRIGEPLIKATSVIPSEFHISSGEAIPRILENPTVVKLDEVKP